MNQNPSFRMQWIKNDADIEQVTPDNGLLFVATSLGELFQGDVMVSIGHGEVTAEYKPGNIMCHVSGFSITDAIGEWWQTIPVDVHWVGDLNGGYSRKVYVCNIGGLANVRAGLTIHETRGTWSSWPPHKFEIEALFSPVQDYDFQERFGYVTEPSYSWALQVVNSDKLSPVRVVKDRDIGTIPLSSHPVVAAPGCRLAYFWAYTGDDVTKMEKFSKSGRV